MGLGTAVKSIIYTTVRNVGDPATLSRTTSAYNARTDTTVATAQNDWSVYVTPPERMKTFDVPQSSVEAGELNLLLPAQGLSEEPQKGWSLTHLGRVLRITEVEPFTLQGVKVGFMLYCKK